MRRGAGSGAIGSASWAPAKLSVVVDRLARRPAVGSAAIARERLSGRRGAEQPERLAAAVGTQAVAGPRPGELLQGRAVGPGPTGEILDAGEWSALLCVRPPATSAPPPWRPSHTPTPPAPQAPARPIHPTLIPMGFSAPCSEQRIRATLSRGTLPDSMRPTGRIAAPPERRHCDVARGTPQTPIPRRLQIRLARTSRANHPLHRAHHPTRVHIRPPTPESPAAAPRAPARPADKSPSAARSSARTATPARSGSAARRSGRRASPNAAACAFGKPKPEKPMICAKTLSATSSETPFCAAPTMNRRW